MFPSEQYGKIVWDTHIYTWSQHNHEKVEDLEEVLSYYDKDLSKLQKFQKDQNTSVLVGEFTLANLELVLSSSGPGRVQVRSRLGPGRVQVSSI